MRYQRLELWIQHNRRVEYSVLPRKSRVPAVPLRDHADGLCADAVAGVLRGEKFIPRPVRTSGTGVVGGDGEHGGAGLDHVESDERLDPCIGIRAGVHRVFQ